MVPFHITDKDYNHIASLLMASPGNGSICVEIEKNSDVLIFDTILKIGYDVCFNNGEPMHYINSIRLANADGQAFNCNGDRIDTDFDAGILENLMNNLYIEYN